LETASEKGSNKKSPSASTQPLKRPRWLEEDFSSTVSVTSNNIPRGSGRGHGRGCGRGFCSRGQRPRGRY
jgi:hypothetical protein